MKMASDFPALDAIARRNHRIAVWSGQLFLVGMLLGWGIFAGFLTPPPAPSLPTSEVIAFLADGGLLQRVGLSIALIGVGGLIPMSAVIGDQLRRMEGGRSIWADTQLVCSGLLVWLLSQAFILFAVAAFRADRDPQLIQLIYDAGWLTFIAPVSMVVIWQAAVGAAIISDRNPKPVLPRWLGYLSFWAALLSAPGFIAILFHNGPFAWNGLFALWIPIAIYVVWWIALTVQLLRNINAEMGSSST